MPFAWSDTVARLREALEIEDVDGALDTLPVHLSLARAELVLVTGGLGPTKDDVTKKTLADHFGMRLVEHPEVLAGIERLGGRVEGTQAGPRRAVLREQVEVALGVVPGAAVGVVHQPVHILLRQDDGQDAVLEAVVVEDVGERRGDDCPKSSILECPRCVFSRRSGTEVGAGDEDHRLGVLPAIEDEARVRLTLGILCPIPEEERSKAGALNALEELLRNDLVGVDIGPRQGGHLTRDDGDGLHHDHARMSTKRPSIAAAAAIAGLTKWVRPSRP
mgnify:CR=1 FL=1